METQPNLKISIPTPCHEDWNKMTPGEKGSFCGKCCKTVIDFSHKTPEEIRDTLLAQSGKKVCGRFESHQLDEPQKELLSIHIPYYLLPKNISYRKAFAIALFFVFGTSLFSCRTTEDHIVGDIAISVDTARMSNAGLTGTERQLSGDTVKPECSTGDVKLKNLQGEVEMTVRDTVKTPPPDTLIEPKMGKIRIH